MNNFIDADMVKLTGERKREVYEFLSAPYKDRPFFLIKYCKEESHAKGLLNGNLFIRKAGAYKKIEEETGERGTGDKNEMSCPVPYGTDCSITIDALQQTFKIPIVEGCESSILDLRDLDMLIYCLTWIDYPEIDSIDIYENEKEIKCDICIPLKHMDTEEYKYCAVFTDPLAFCTEVKKYIENHNATYLQGLVIYSSNTQQRFNDFANSSARRFFYKDNFFKGQNEYRIVTDLPEPPNNIIHLGKQIQGFVFPLDEVQELAFLHCIKKLKN